MPDDKQDLIKLIEAHPRVKVVYIPVGALTAPTSWADSYALPMGLKITQKEPNEDYFLLPNSEDELRYVNVCKLPMPKILISEIDF